MTGLVPRSRHHALALHQLQLAIPLLLQRWWLHPLRNPVALQSGLLIQTLQLRIHLKLRLLFCLHPALAAAHHDLLHSTDLTGLQPISDSNRYRCDRCRCENKYILYKT